MRIVECVDLLNPEVFDKSAWVQQAWKDIEAAIHATDWPHGSKVFKIHPSLKGNGVKPIKLPCISYLSRRGWQTECLPTLGSDVLSPGDLDGMISSQGKLILFEWETGNISSSHRAINKLLLGMQQLGSAVEASFLVVPSNSFKIYLTDRIGNIGELRPYFPLWSSISSVHGLLRIVVVEHDAVDVSVPLIPKGSDGMAPPPIPKVP